MNPVRVMLEVVPVMLHFDGEKTPSNTPPDVMHDDDGRQDTLVDTSVNCTDGTSVSDADDSADASQRSLGVWIVDIPKLRQS
jgi:hypothetical protein